ncbi:MAG: DUF5060 domain-containing protein [Phycisphaerales bacterium]
MEKKIGVLLALTSMFAASAIAELLTNPGFENNMTGWSVITSNGNVSSSTTAHSGAKSSKFETGDKDSPYSGYVYASQTIAYDNSSEYTLSVYARDNWSNGDPPMANAITLKIEYYNASSALLRSDVQLSALPKDGAWHFYTFTSTDIPQGTATLKITIGTTQDTEWMKSVLFDDASLTGIIIIPPEPHTGDLNNDLNVNMLDFGLFADDWRQTAVIADLVDISNNWLMDYSSLLTIKPSMQSVEKYGYVSFDINSVAPFTNQYNPDDIRVDIIFDTPDSSQIILPCFYVSGNAAASKWQGRFTPQKTGQYLFQAKVFVDGDLDGISEKSYLNVSESDKDGILHKNPSSYYFFKFDSGKTFRGIGENVAWDTRSYNGQTYSYEYLFPRLGNNGCNFARVWLCHWNIPLEWASIGRYTETAAAKLDAVLALAEQNGLYLTVSLDTYSAFRALEDPTWGGGDDWLRNPYNVANGGPCTSASAFFTNTTAKKMYKNKLRYFIARWGYNPHVGAIEFFNEVDHLYNDGDAKVPAADIVSWHEEMSTYLKALDPFKHLVTTSFSYKWMPDLWNVSNLDFTQTHPYGTTTGAYSTITSYENNFSKPYVMGEFGYSWENAGNSSNHYLFRRELHMGMWRGMFSPTPILPMVWWWENLAYNNDWDVFDATALFANQMTSDSLGNLSNLSVNAGSSIEAMGVKNTSKMYAWMLNKTTSTLTGAVLTISNVTNGNYQYRFYNTWLGTYTAPTSYNVTNGTMQITLPSMPADNDIACEITRL